MECAAPYDEYLAAQGIFQLRDGSLDEHEPTTEKEIIRAVAAPKREELEKVVSGFSRSVRELD